MAKKRPRKINNTRPMMRQRGWVFGVLAVAIVTLVSVGVIVLRSGEDNIASDQPTQQVMTLDPQVVLNLTQLPQATPLSGAEADRWHLFRAMVDQCHEYTPQRRSQMEQHIAWLLDPSEMPPDIILALGNDQVERLVFGMASYTSIEWKLRERQLDSCLVPIGRELDVILIALGTEPFGIYDETEKTP